MGRQLELLMREPTRHNVFLAAVPDTSVIATITAGIMRDLLLSAAPITPDRLHVSLLSIGGFDGSCPPSVIEAVIRAAAEVSMAPFKVRFDRVASFSGGQKKQALVLTGTGDGIVGFVALRKALIEAMMKASLRLPPQPSFSPHMTMMYDERVCEFPIEPIEWTVSRFGLVDSLVGQSRHVHLAQWPLQKSNQAA